MEALLASPTRDPREAVEKTNQALVCALGNTHRLAVLTAASRGPKGTVLGVLVGLAWTGVAMAATAGVGGGVAVASLTCAYNLGKVGDGLEEAYTRWRESAISSHARTKENALELLKVLLAGGTPLVADLVGGAAAAKTMLRASPFVGAVARVSPTQYCSLNPVLRCIYQGFTTLFSL